MTDRDIPAPSGSPFHPSPNAYDRPNITYPQVSTLQHPPPARINHAKRLSEGQATDNTRVQGSMSSASESSSFSYRKQQAPIADSHWPSPTRERTLVNSEPHNSTQWRSSDSARMSHSHKKSVMTERQSSALSHIHERRQLEQDHEDEDEEDDHAIWILVRTTATLYISTPY